MLTDEGGWIGTLAFGGDGDTYVLGNFTMIRLWWFSSVIQQWWFEDGVHLTLDALADTGR